MKNVRKNKDDYFSPIIDLHGLDSNEASSIVRSSLLSLDEDNFTQEIIFITGHGEGVLKFIVEEILEEQGYLFFKENNGANFRVFKKIKYDDFEF